jgi:hypothetical protein
MVCDSQEAGRTRPTIAGRASRSLNAGLQPDIILLHQRGLVYAQQPQQLADQRGRVLASLRLQVRLLIFR